MTLPLSITAVEETKRLLFPFTPIPPNGSRIEAAMALDGF